MFSVNDTVMYGRSGICKITEICDKKFGKETHKYYVLHPLYGDNTVIYCPVDSEKVPMRRLLTAQDVLSLIREMPEQQSDWIENDNLRKEAQTEVLRGGDHKALIALVKMLYRKRIETENSGKRFHRADADAMAQAENMLYQEFAEALGITPEEVVPFIIESLEKQENP